MDEVIILEAAPTDAPAILALQKRAYQEEAELYNDFEIAPLRQTLAELEADFGKQVIFKAVSGAEIVGSVRAHLQAGTCYVGRLIVAPEFQNRGIGSRLLAEVERHFAGATRFELFTGHQSLRNLYLYQKRGYQIFKDQPVNEKLRLVFLEKVPG